MSGDYLTGLEFAISEEKKEKRRRLQEITYNRRLLIETKKNRKGLMSTLRKVIEQLRTH
jgi:hypothetical protein